MTYAQGTIAFMVPPLKISQPATWISLKRIRVFELEAAWSQSAANAVNLAREKPISMAWLPMVSSFGVTIRSSMPFP